MTQAVINPEAVHWGRQASFSRLGSLEKMVKLSQSCEYPLLCAMQLPSTFQNQLVHECYKRPWMPCRSLLDQKTAPLHSSPKELRAKSALKHEVQPHHTAGGWHSSSWEPRCVPAQRAGTERNLEWHFTWWGDVLWWKKRDGPVPGFQNLSMVCILKVPLSVK